MPKERPVDISLGDQLPLGSRIRLLRRSHQVRSAHMARDIGYDKGHISNIENNRVHPSQKLLTKISNYLGVSSEELLEVPISQLIPGDLAQYQSNEKGPSIQVRKRTLGPRVERILAMGHLSPEDQKLVEESVVVFTSQIVVFTRSMRGQATDSNFMSNSQTELQPFSGIDI